LNLAWPPGLTHLVRLGTGLSSFRIRAYSNSVPLVSRGRSRTRAVAARSAADRRVKLGLAGVGRSYPALAVPTRRSVVAPRRAEPTRRSSAAGAPARAKRAALRRRRKFSQQLLAGRRLELVPRGERTAWVPHTLTGPLVGRGCGGTIASGQKYMMKASPRRRAWSEHDKVSVEDREDEPRRSWCASSCLRLLVCCHFALQSVRLC